ncbi:MAG: UDP-4-amino-4,6-dideoxy-N-acetyl-beta-L-altrosamine N-acetyltransferase [Clostridium sp.]|jgi:UDP-4-amino-4,6-dideoxy-N-acetyl-beta-L-altrosamine N-acetyltransferase|nr:UDP-4-amino-4,6-dideoxy-N-acetyl-beta-L-altrosamine N-acetyltransferase [Clostridium sp.]
MKELKFERIREEWLETIRNWRMDPRITKYMNTDPVLTLDGQKEWLKKVQADPAQRQWLLVTEEVPVGVASLAGIDRENERCGWGYYVADWKRRSLERAVQIEVSLYEYVFSGLGLQKLYSEMFAENEEVIRLHEMCGSRRDGRLRRHVKKNGVYYDIVHMSILREEWNDLREDFREYYEASSFEESEPSWWF